MATLAAGASITLTLAAGSGQVLTVQMGGKGNLVFGPGPQAGRSEEIGSSVLTHGPFARGDATIYLTASAPITYSVSPPNQVLSASQNNALLGRATEVVIFGDSIAEQQFADLAGALNNATTARGSVHHWNALIGSKLRVIGNAGKGGTTSGSIAISPADVGGNAWLNRIDAAIKMAPGYLWLGYPENDQTFGVEAADTIAHLQTIYAKAGNVGIKVIQATALGDARPVDPNSLPGNSISKMQAHLNTVSAWIKANARTYGIMLYEQTAPTANVSTGAPATNIAYDNLIHPAAFGGGAIGVYNSTRLTLPDVPPYEYQSALNWRNGVANGALLGSGGVATGFTGTAPDGWTLYKSGTIGTPVASSVARVDGRQGAYLALTATSGAINDRLGLTQQIDLKVSYSAKVWVKGARMRSSVGEHWVVTTGGLSVSGSEPAAFAASSILGQTITDGAATWTRVETLNAGDVFEVIAAFQVVGVSDVTKGMVPVILANVIGGTGGGRAMNFNTGDAYPTCYAKASATPGLQDMVIRSMPISFSAATTALTVFFYIQADTGITFTSVTGSVDLAKIIDA